MRYVVQYSGGICSWFAAKRILERHPKESVTLLFADTLIEDPDLYRFLDESTADLGIPLTRIADGRTPWQVFRDVRFLGNSRVDPCSKILKRDLLDKWHREHCDPATTVICVGLSGEKKERDRYRRFRSAMRSRGWPHVEAPAMEPPYAHKEDMLSALRERKIDPPELYEDGFPHNNCGGMCVKMGHANARLALAKRPATYMQWEKEENAFREFIGKDVSILSDRSGDNKKKPLTLTEFRKRVEAGEVNACNDWGGCGCAIDA